MSTMNWQCRSSVRPCLVCSELAPALMSASSFRRVKRRNSTVTSEGGATRFFRLGRCSASHHSHFRNVLRVRNAASRRTTALPKLLGVLLALGGVTLICGRLLGFNSPFPFSGGVAVVVGAASAAYADVLVTARSIQLVPDLLAAWSSIS